MGIDEEGTSPRSRCAAVTYLIKKSRNTAAANPSSNCRSHTVNQGLSPRLVIVDYCLLRFGGWCGRVLEAQSPGIDVRGKVEYDGQ